MLVCGIVNELWFGHVFWGWLNGQNARKGLIIQTQTFHSATSIPSPVCFLWTASCPSCPVASSHQGLAMNEIAQGLRDVHARYFELFKPVKVLGNSWDLGPYFDLVLANVQLVLMHRV